MIAGIGDDSEEVNKQWGKTNSVRKVGKPGSML